MVTRRQPSFIFSCPTATRIIQPNLETPSFYLFGQAPQERQVLLLRPRGHAERQRPRRLDKVVREELAEFDGVEGLDQLKVAQHRLELRRVIIVIVLRAERCGSDRHRGMLFGCLLCLCCLGRTDSLLCAGCVW
jgi:hypothetical protein